VAVIRRFDRDETDGRIPYQSAASLLQASREEDRSYTEVADAIRTHGHAPTQDVRQLWRRLVFNLLITNVDDHMQNHGFLHVSQGQWRLATGLRHQSVSGQGAGVENLAVRTGWTDHRCGDAVGPRAPLRAGRGRGSGCSGRGSCRGSELATGRNRPGSGTAAGGAGRLRAGLRAQTNGCSRCAARAVRQARDRLAAFQHGRTQRESANAIGLPERTRRWHWPEWRGTRCPAACPSACGCCPSVGPAAWYRAVPNLIPGISMGGCTLSYSVPAVCSPRTLAS